MMWLWLGRGLRRRLLLHPNSKMLFLLSPHLRLLLRRYHLIHIDISQNQIIFDCLVM
jgi:hypothetical protein